MSSRLLALLLAAALSSPVPARDPVAGAPAHPPTSEGAQWSELPPAQQAALAPLRAYWGRLDADRRSKWLRVAERFPGLPPQEQQRMQARMAQWATMSPGERSRARQGFQELRRLPAADRQALWEAYRALPTEQRQALADTRATPERTRRSSSRHASAPGDARKRTVPVNPQAAVARPIAPTVVQVEPGTTTTLMNRRPSPPLHHQPGLPKITATPDFVDAATLLPNRGPQGAATIRLAPTPPGALTPIAAPQRPAASGAVGRARAAAAGDS
ncbi:MAG TPA: DUF3106 domain-containing protein [Rubrivivax sp.]|nr:DUF3106 domain-containing protein [Burkholderiales bacterium]HNT39693.1 DUF3106 domain-containing protein [Rubrivivax sp.]